MERKIRLYKGTFDALLSEVKTKYERLLLELNFEPKGKGAFYYGFGPGTNYPSTLRKVIFEASDEALWYQYIDSAHIQWLNKHGKALKKLSAKYLYNLALQSESSNDPYDIFEVNGILLTLLCRFVGYQTLDQFIDDFPNILKEDKQLQRKLLQLDKKELSEEDLATKYLGLYWSYIEGQRKCLEVWINYYNKTQGKFPAKVVGLHSAGRQEFDGVSYDGMAEETETCIMVSLKERTKGHTLSVIGYKGHGTVRDMDNIFCAATGISKFGYPLSFELILVKLPDQDKKKSYESILKNMLTLPYLDFYLQVQRRNFRIPPRIVGNLAAIQARGKRSMEVVHFRGTYRLWSLEYKGVINQIKLEVKKDFSILFHIIAHNNNYRQQKGLFSFNTNFNKLCISAHNEYGVDVLNYVFLDVNPDGDNQFGKGIYCGIGTTNENVGKTGMLVGERLIYFRDDSSFEPARLNETDVASILRNNPTARSAFPLLLSSNRIDRRVDFTTRLTQFLQKVEQLIANED